MSMLCRLGGHEAAEGEVWNQGYYFSRCRRCGRDMIRTGAEWQVVPEGHRVVWKNGWHRHSVQADYRSNLPAVPTGSAFYAWERSISEVAGPGIGSAATAAAEQEEQPYPYLLALAAIAGGGLQLLMREKH
ncbi:MAG: hypothetical protein E6G94_00965 [Alphaproteobacteria bacterium]|nr:MAG: hypothetical protein E6G94_00965 [Alphaproteobacteria bacterium]